MTYSPLQRRRTTTSTEATPYVRSLGGEISFRVCAIRALLNTASRDVGENVLFGNALLAIYDLYREHDNLVLFMSDYSASLGERLADIVAQASLAADHLRKVVPIQFTPEQRRQYQGRCEELQHFVTDWHNVVQSQLSLALLVEVEREQACEDILPIKSSG